MHDEPISPRTYHHLNELLRNSGLELQEECIIYVYIRIYVYIHVSIHKTSQQVEVLGSDSLPHNVV